MELVDEVKAEIASRAAAETDNQPEVKAAPDPALDSGSTTTAADASPESSAVVTDSSASPEPVKVEPTSWINDDAKAEAAALGIEDDELTGFTSREEFDRAARLAARQLADAGRQYREARSQQPAAASSPAPTAPATTTGQPKSGAQPEQPAKHLEALKAAGYDDPVILKLAEEFDALKAHQTQREAAEQQQAQQRLQAEQERTVEEVHDALDSLDAERYGKSLDEKGAPIALSKDAEDRRRKVFEWMDNAALGARLRGRAVPPIPTLARMADNAVFAKENADRARAKQAKETADKIRVNRGAKLGSGGKTAMPAPHKGPNSSNPEFMARALDIIENGA